jgi:hypothetical protein
MNTVALQLCDLLINSVIPKYFQKYVTTEYYPIIVGGSAVSRCLRLYPETSALLNDVFKSDIDVDFVVANTKAVTLKSASEAQYGFVSDITSDNQFKQFFQKHKDYKYDVVKRQIPSKPTLQVVTLKLKYKLEKPVDIMDTVLFTETDKISYKFFQSYFDVKYPILRQTDNNMLYGSCEWIFYDTVRMMFIYDMYLQKPEKDASASSRLFYFKKLKRYVLKFSALYIAVHEGNYHKAKTVYNHVLSLLQSALTNSSVVTEPDSAIPVKEQKYLHKVITNMMDADKDLVEYRKRLIELCQNDACI